MPALRMSRKKTLSRTPESDVDLARFVAERTRELALLTGRARWPLLTYFLNMARIEAESRSSVDAPVERRKGPGARPRAG